MVLMSLQCFWVVAYLGPAIVRVVIITRGSNRIKLVSIIATTNHHPAIDKADT